MDYRALYGETADEREPLERYRSIGGGFRALNGKAPEVFYSSPGRAEIVGNHTDHNLGKVIVAAVSCDIVAAVGRRADGLAEIVSKGFAPCGSGSRIPRRNVTRRGGARRLRAAWRRGWKKGFFLKGFGGFTAYTESTVFRGAGVSSSAAFEVLIAEIFNDLWLGGRLTAKDKAAVGHFAENEYFGKPCGLLDQSGVACGGLNKIDFKTPDAPVVSPCPYRKGIRWSSPIRAAPIRALPSITRPYARIWRPLRLFSEKSFCAKSTKANFFVPFRRLKNG
ncbi:MAG: galactokinase family protein [Christensenellaceae bacterium]